MHIFATDILFHLGATSVTKFDVQDDPTTEEEFLQLDYQSPNPITWQQYQDVRDVVIKKKAVKLIRIYRSRLLQQTDWILTVDNWESLTNKNEWKSYRQALRDLPETLVEYKWNPDGSLDFENMNVPIEPPILRSTPS